MFPEGTCVEDLDNVLFPSDGRDGSSYRSATCSAIRVERSRGGSAEDRTFAQELPADGLLPRRLEVTDRVAVVLLPACRPPTTACADFFGVILGGERLHARSNEIARQIATGQIGRDISAAGPRAKGVHALRTLLALASLGATLSAACA
uniref:Uncharacterized protein n=1 Tax=Alexandrium andersonii TaxID=327968 RepID=A0A7S2MB32_9DINO